MQFVQWWRLSWTFDILPNSAQQFKSNLISKSRLRRRKFAKYDKGAYQYSIEKKLLIVEKLSLLRLVYRLRRCITFLNRTVLKRISNTCVNKHRETSLPFCFYQSYVHTAWYTCVYCCQYLAWLWRLAKAFGVSAPSVWNSLSFDCRSAQLASSFRRSMLKTELFDIAYTEHSD